MSETPFRSLLILRLLLTEAVGRWATAVSHTPFWLLSGWEHRGRRLSRGRRNPGRQCGRRPHRRITHGRAPTADETTHTRPRYRRHRDGPEFSGIPLRLAFPVVPSDRPDRGHNSASRG